MDVWEDTCAHYSSNGESDGKGDGEDMGAAGVLWLMKVWGWCKA